MNEYTLKKASEDNIKEVLKIENLCFPDPWTEGMFFSSIAPGIDFTLLFDRSEIIGFSITDRRVIGENELHNIAITPSRRGKGLSKMLMDKIISDTETGTAIFLEVRAKNTVAEKLYKKYGFREIGVRKNYYKNPEEDAVLMIRE